MFAIRVKSELADRIDAEFYSPEALAAIGKIKSIGETSTLGDEINEGYRVVYHGTDSVTHLSENETLGFLSPSQINSDGDIDFNSIDRLPVYYKNDYPKGLAKSGEILIEVKGNVSKVAIVPSAIPKNLMISGSLYKATISKKMDAHYVFAYLKSAHGQLLKGRLTSNTIINYIGKDDLYSIPLLVAAPQAQRYLGDKVRQAEQLRAWANALFVKNNNVFEQEIGSYDDTEARFERVPTNLLDVRLDQNHYRKSLLNCLKQLLKQECINLGNKDFFEGLTDGDHGNPVYGKGPFYLRTNEMDENMLFTDTIVTVESNYANSVSSSCWAVEGDVVFSIVGTLGLTAVINQNTMGLMSRGIAKVSSKKLPNYYLKSFFRTRYFQHQLERHSVGSVQRGVYLSSLEKIVVPNLPSELINKIASLEKLAEDLSIYSRNLVKTSKSLIEALIDQNVSEEQLINAQQSLEVGDSSLDKELLSQLTVTGFNDGGKPLFDDLDQLYDLLEQSKEFMEAKA